MRVLAGFGRGFRLPRIAPTGIMQQFLVREGFQEFHKIMPIAVGQREPVKNMGLVRMVEFAAGGVVVDHSLESRQAAIVHVRRCESFRRRHGWALRRWIRRVLKKPPRSSSLLRESLLPSNRMPPLKVHPPWH